MDPGDDSIPRGSFRAGLKNDGRIVQISLGRGAQEAGALRSLNSAFPFLRGASTNELEAQSSNKLGHKQNVMFER
ncbi:hypothetical protein OS493_028525 [Desmophyllum pertusum]|uniref:Uncharacterized protein n=1 Tax=Desmophyllum pertusum TaxID=174260 RepID=A0A9W9Z9L2_9CNID|nr:hypothetical protein OS493_028525 [Desmophyllum pertusum]